MPTSGNMINILRMGGFSLVVGSLGSWYPRNDEIRSILGINGRSWGAFRFKARLAAIQGSMDMVCAHFHHGAPNPEAEDIPPFPVETPYPVITLKLVAACRERNGTYNCLVFMRIGLTVKT
ncbi:hypothetical protein OUZ56_033746 [Daphnia magna]|uniref:Uncharacterized protein n=1 Tax=Daphnia magna TaxID=35525 RepID=A0ABR0BB24_9CRUS|nr:hypothetical protein OUZ56_033746 [Daphnia magna]